MIDQLKHYCVNEVILKDLHCLLHTDDTYIISTTRENFEKKSDVLLSVIAEKKMKINWTKSGYMFTNGKDIVDVFNIDQ